jgi:hypothetical protein
LLIAAFLCLLPRTGADEPKKNADTPKKAAELSASDLALDVAVLRTLLYLRATPEQLDSLRKLANETMAKPRPRKGKASAEFQKILTELREALAEEDEERVEGLDDQLDELTRTESPELDEDVRLTPAARKQAPNLLRRLKPNQAASFLGLYADEIPAPEDRLLDLLDKVRGWKEAEWKDKRDALGDELAALVAGVDEAKAAKVRGEVLDLLGRTRGLKADEFESRRGELENTARRLVGGIGPTEVLRHFLEYRLAELLSNPRLVEALKTRMKGGI